MFYTILKATNTSFQKGMTFCRSIYVKKVVKLLAFIFEHPAYELDRNYRTYLFNVFIASNVPNRPLHTI